MLPKMGKMDAFAANSNKKDGSNPKSVTVEIMVSVALKSGVDQNVINHIGFLQQYVSPHGLPGPSRTLLLWKRRLLGSSHYAPAGPCWWALQWAGFLSWISQLDFSTLFLNCKCSGCSIEYKWLAMQCVPTRQRIRLVSCIFQTTPLCPASLISTFFSLSFFQLLFNFPTTLVQLFN